MIVRPDPPWNAPCCYPATLRLIVGGGERIVLGKGDLLSRIQELKRNLSLSLQESSWDDALAVLGRLVEVEGSQPAYHNQIGDILLKSGRQLEAMDSFMRGVKAYRELEMFPNGAALCKKILRLDPEQRDAIWFLGELKTRQGFLSDGAEKMLEGLRAYAEDPDYARDDLLEKLGHAESLQAGNREALEFVATSYARMNEAEMARCTTLRIAELEEREGKGDKARELRRHAQELCPQTEEAQTADSVEPESVSEPLELAPVIPEASEETAVPQLDSGSKDDESIESLTLTPPTEQPGEVPPAVECEAHPAPECDSVPVSEIEAETASGDDVDIMEITTVPEAPEEAAADEEMVEVETPAPPIDEIASEEVELLEITVPELTRTEPEYIEAATETGVVEMEETDSTPESKLEQSDEAEGEADDEVETMEFVLPETPDPDFQAILNPKIEEEACEPEATNSQESPQPISDHKEEAGALAESMLELMEGDGDDLPEIEILGGNSVTQEDQLTTRQMVGDLCGGLADGSGVELIHEDDGTEVLSTSSPCPEVMEQPGATGSFADIMNTDPAMTWPGEHSWPGGPGGDGEKPDSEPDKGDDDLELHSMGDSLQEADGDWSAAPSEDESMPERPGHKKREIHFDAGGDGDPISFGLTTTAGEALQTDDVEEVLSEFRRRMKEQMGSMAPEERYQLGVSYMEMGLHEEALDEFEHTLEHKVLGARTREWMARCLLELSRPREIVLLLQTRLDAETYPHKSMVELYYVLGQAYEQLKAWDLALDAYTKVYQLDSEFRDVQEKLALLTNAE